jgi:[FeFe] hydrogenase H-cluster maturation GTPase HydF
MNETPRGNRLHLVLFGRVNAGKSTLLNLITGQETSIVSPVPGTTTDPVEKAVELQRVGPVQLIDTPGLGDASSLSALRRGRTARAFDRADIALLVIEAGRWGDAEEFVVDRCRASKIPLLAVVTKCDLAEPTDEFLRTVRGFVVRVMTVSAVDRGQRDAFLRDLENSIALMLPREAAAEPLLSDLVPAGGVVVLVTPIDAQAPRGRLILPQAQAIRDCLDGSIVTVVVKETELARALRTLNRAPDLVVCDSQVVLQVMSVLPAAIRCTTFSILFARAKGGLVEAARGAARLRRLVSGDRVLIAEACTHHALDVDIGRVKIPRWLHAFTGAELSIDVAAGTSFPDSVAGYAAVIHCGGCMLTRTEMCRRIETAESSGVTITNYGVAIAMLQNVIERALAPFPAALRAYEKELRESEVREDAVRA